MDIVSGLWRKDSGSHAELRKIAFTPAGLVVPSRDWLIGRADERVARGRTAGPAAGTRRRRPGHDAGGREGPGGPPGRRRRPAAGTAPAARGPGGHRRPARTRAGTGVRRPARARGGPARRSRRAPSAERLDRIERGPGQRVTGGDVAALRSVGELFRALDHAYGGGHARQALVRYLEHEAEPMLRGVLRRAAGPAAVRGRRRPDPARRLDLVRHRRARPRPALLRPGPAAGPGGRGPGVRRLRPGHDEPAGRLPRARQGGRPARPGRPAGHRLPRRRPSCRRCCTRSRPAGTACWARSGPVRAALARAERALETARPGDDVPHWARFFDEAQLADEFGHCHRDLQQYRAAAQHAERSLQLRAPAYARSRLFCRVVLASARLGLGELEQACALGAEAAQQAAEMRSVRATSTYGTSSAGWSRTATPSPCAATGTGWPRSAEPDGRQAAAAGRLRPVVPRRRRHAQVRAGSREAARRPECSAPWTVLVSRWSPQTYSPASTRTGRRGSCGGGMAGTASGSWWAASSSQSSVGRAVEPASWARTVRSRSARRRRRAPWR